MTDDTPSAIIGSVATGSLRGDGGGGEVMTPESLVTTKLTRFIQAPLQILPDVPYSHLNVQEKLSKASNRVFLNSLNSLI